MILLALWGASLAVQAAPVNAEALVPNGNVEGSSLGFDGSVAASTGNVAWLDLGAALRAQLQSNFRDVAEEPTIVFLKERWFVTANTRFAERPDGPYIDRSFGHARWTRMATPRLGGEVFGQLSTDAFLRLQFRGLVGVLGRWLAANQPAHQAWLATGPMWEAERIDVAIGSGDEPSTSVFRWTSALTVRLDPWKGRVLLQNTAYVQPSMAEFADVRVLNDFELMAPVSEVVSFGLTVSVQHDSRPPTDVKPTDLRLSNTLRVAL